MFFKPKTNLSDAEKARIEFHLQQLAECIGFDRFALPVLSRKTLLELYESNQDPQDLIEFVGDHLAHDVGELRFHVDPQQAQLDSSCGSGCGGGSCDGPSGLPGKYDANERSIILEVETDTDPQMVMATLINGVVRDLLQQNDFGSAHLPEQVELTVVGTGLGMFRNHIGLVKRQTNYWDSTQWELFPRPFLDCQSLAYANAIAAWVRKEATPEWASDLPGELKRPMRKSLKYLLKTNDSFFHPHAKRFLLKQSQSEWWKLGASPSASKQVIAIRHIASEGKLNDEQESLLLEKLRSDNLAIVLNAIAATERIALHQRWVASESVFQELRMLVEHRNDEVQAKAICALARLERLDDTSVETAAMMLEADFRHLVLAGVFSLSTLNSIPDHVLPVFDRCFFRALQTCDCEFIELFVAAYKRWLDDPQSHLEGILQDSPEHLPIALEALQNTTDQLLQVRRGA